MVKVRVYYLTKRGAESKVVDEKDRKVGFFDSVHNVTLAVSFRKPDGTWGPIAGKFLREEKVFSPYASKAKKKKKK